MIEDSSKLIIAALTGACLGGGMELALSAQYRVADNTLKYGLLEVKIGLIKLNSIGLMPTIQMNW